MWGSVHVHVLSHVWIFHQYKDMFCTCVHLDAHQCVRCFARLNFSNILKGIAGINYVSFFTVYVSKNFIFPSKTNSEKVLGKGLESLCEFSGSVLYIPDTILHGSSLLLITCLLIILSFHFTMYFSNDLVYDWISLLFCSLFWCLGSTISLCCQILNQNEILWSSFHFWFGTNMIDNP